MGPINLEDATANAVNVNLPDGKCSDLGVPALQGLNIAPMRVGRGGRLMGKTGKGCKGEVLAGGCGGVPRNKDRPSPGQS